MKKKQLTTEDQAMQNWFNENQFFVGGLLLLLIIGLSLVLYWIIN